MQVHTLRGGYLLRPLGGYTNARVERRNTAEAGMTATAAQLVHLALTSGVTVKASPTPGAPTCHGFSATASSPRRTAGYAAGPALGDALDITDWQPSHTVTLKRSRRRRCHRTQRVTSLGDNRMSADSRLLLYALPCRCCRSRRILDVSMWARSTVRRTFKEGAERYASDEDRLLKAMRKDGVDL